MSHQSIGNLVLHDPPVLSAGESLETAVRRLLDSGLPALPVVDADERLAGIFGEREFMAALFPGYVRELKYAGFVSRSLDEALEMREACRREPVGRHMNTEHIEVEPDFSDVQLAEIFLHHRVLVIPVVAGGHVEGMVTRSGFFRAIAERFLG